MTGSSVTLKVYNPTGTIETMQIHAPRLDTLAGKTICELSNGLWEYDRIFPAIREALQKQFPTAKIVPYTETIWLRSVIDNLDQVSKVVKEKECQAVIVGMAA
jgi:hypothetical protein